jgi:predicted RNA-binding protein with RPS1 domain
MNVFYETIRYFTDMDYFIDLGEGKTGLVHISEISNGFVKDIHDVLTVGDEVLSDYYHETHV